MTLASEKEEQYQTIMQNLVRRYVTEVCHRYVTYDTDMSQRFLIIATIIVTVIVIIIVRNILNNFRSSASQRTRALLKTMWTRSRATFLLSGFKVGKEIF